MRVLFTVALWALLALSVSATHTFYTRSTAPKGWSKGNPASGHEGVEFMIALKQRNMDVLEKIFWEVSDPNHDNYQKFMTPREIMDIIAPEHETVHAVKHWLKKHGATHIKDFGDALEVKTTAAIASKLFDTTFHSFIHEDGSVVIRQWGSYSVPLAIKKHVDMITGISTFPVPHYGLKKPKSPMDNQGVVAQTLASIYQIRAEKPAGSNSTSQGVIEFQGQNFAPADLATYAQQCNITAQTVSAANTVGPNDPTNPQTEAELDIQMIATVNIESTPWFWLEPGNGWLYPFGVHFSSTASVPQVISISYGWWEGGQCDIAPDECSQLGVNSQVYVSRVNAEFQKIGLRGVSILSATGDSGANGRTNEDCSVPQLRAAFPGSSPYLTGVGATQLNNPVYNLPNPPPICASSGYPCPSGGQEVAVSYDVASFASGGGFSNYTAQPAYQKAAVTAYLNSGVPLPPSSYFNAAGRAFPDVAAIGHNTLIYQGGVQPVGGTSASTPIFAGVVALLNEIAVDKSGKPLGFLNPLLYQAAATSPQVFHDITVGDNKCTEQGCSATCQGFLATKGWDPVTGLGSPNVNKLAGYVSGHFDARAKKHHKKHHQHHKHH